MKKEQNRQKTFSLDSTDIKILNLLQADGKLTVRELSAKVNLSPTPVHERLKRLEDSGIISHYTAVLNTDKLGQVITFFVNVKLREHSNKAGADFIKKMSALKEVTELHIVGGDHDFMARVTVKDMGEYRNFFLEKLGSVPHIAQVQSIIVLDTVKRDTRIHL